MAGGVPFLSDAQLKTALSEANVLASTADAVVETNAQSRIEGLRAAVSVLALFTLVALLFTRGIPTVQPGAERIPGSPPTGQGPAADLGG